MTFAYRIIEPAPIPPSIEDSARHMAEYRCLKDRERVKANCRQMRAERNLPPLAALEPR